MRVAPNAKCQRVLVLTMFVLAVWLVVIAISLISSLLSPFTTWLCFVFLILMLILYDLHLSCYLWSALSLTT